MPIQRFEEEPYAAAKEKGFDDFEAMLTCGGDDRSLILESSTNKYHIRPQPVDPAHVFRGSCTGNPPTQFGYDAAKRLYEKLSSMEDGSMDSAIDEVFADQRSRISNILQLELAPVAVGSVIHSKRCSLLSHLPPPKTPKSRHKV